MTSLHLAISLPPSSIHPHFYFSNGYTCCHPLLCSIIKQYTMTTIELLQRYPPHKDPIQCGKAPNSKIAFNDNELDPSLPNSDPSQYFDARTKHLHDMLDRAVKDLASSQLEPVSQWEHTLWRYPHEPRSRSPTYSEISDSFESPDMIEHCITHLLSNPMSAPSTHFKGPDGWPLGIEVAMNDFHRRRLSTPILQEQDLPNKLVVRKKKQQNSRVAENCNRQGQETARCESAPFEQHCNGRHRQESAIVNPLVFQKQQSIVLFQRDGERQDDPDSTNSKPLASQQQGHTRPQQCQTRQESVDLNLPELQEQSDEDTDLDLDCIPNLSARKYGDDQTSLVNASSEFDPALANGKPPIGLGLESAGLELTISQLDSECCDTSRTQIDGTCLLNKHSPQTALSPPPRVKATHDDAHQAEPPFDALVDALDNRSNFSKALDAFEYTQGESIDREVGCQNTSENSENHTFHGIGPLTSEDSEADVDSNIVFWKTSGPLEDILEESEDTLTSALTLDHGQPQHFTPGSAQPLNCQQSSRIGERCDKMLALQWQQTQPPTLSSSPPRVLPALKLTINPSSQAQSESTMPLRYSSNDAKSSELTLSATTMAELKDPTRKKGRLSAAALEEMRKTAESQPHFQKGPSLNDQSQADIHPLLRSKSHRRQSLQPSKITNDSPLKYVFEDDDSEGHDADEGDSFSHQVTLKHDPQCEAQDAESFVTQMCRKEHSSSQSGMMIEDTESDYLFDNDGTESHEAQYTGTSTPQRSTLRYSNDTTLVPSLDNATTSRPSTSRSKKSRLSASMDKVADVMPSSIFHSSMSPSPAGCYPSVGFGSPAAFNSWASTPHSHEHGNCFNTPSSALTLPTSTFPTPNTSFPSSSPTARGTTMTPSSSFGQFSGNSSTSCGKVMTPSSSFGQLVVNSPNSLGIATTPSSSFGHFNGNKTHRRSVSVSSVFGRYHKARYPDLPNGPMTESTVSSREFANTDQARDDPFTSTHSTTPPFLLNLAAPSNENLTDTLSVGADNCNTPTKRNLRRLSLHRRSSSVSERPKTNNGIDRALSSMVFDPHRSRLHKRNHSISGSIDATAKPDGSGPGHRRSLSQVGLSIATSTVEQKWEVAPPPTPLGLRDTFSMRYRAEPIEADDHYTSRKDALQGMKQGLKKVFGRK